MARPRRPADGVTVIDFDGSRFYPAGRYFRSRSPARLLHRAIWEKHHGPVPRGYVLHHVDADPANNDLANLALLPRGDHNRLHLRADPERPRRNLDAARSSPRQHDWHRSPAGRRQLAEQARRWWRDRVPEIHRCVECGTPFETLAPSRGFYCSQNCVQRARRRRGVDNEMRTCSICGAGYERNRYSLVKTCSRTCGTESRRRTLAGLQPHG